MIEIVVIGGAAAGVLIGAIAIVIIARRRDH